MKNSMKNVAHSCLGNYYPFFLNNSGTKEHYLYQLYSPKLNENLVPVVSLTKVSERTLKGTPEGSDLDIVRICLGKRDITEAEAASFIENLVRKDWEGGVGFDEGSDRLPFVEYTIAPTQINQKLLITSLRDALRWKTYRFYPGKVVDILWTRNEFTLFEICEDETHYYLKHLGVIFKNTDTGLTNPVELDLGDNFISARWDKNKTTRAIEINKYLKVLDWASFNKRPIIK